MDNEFEVLPEALQDKGTTLNTTADNEHFPQIEKQIKLTKERVCSIWN